MISNSLPLFTRACRSALYYVCKLCAGQRSGHLVFAEVGGIVPRAAEAVDNAAIPSIHAEVSGRKRMRLSKCRSGAAAC